MATTKKATQVQASTINRVSDKSGNFLGYLVKSNSSSDYYEVTWNTARIMWQCNCKATVHCCHLKAVEEVQEAQQLRPTAEQYFAERQLLALCVTPSVTAKMSDEEVNDFFMSLATAEDARKESELATYDVQAAAVQVLVDAEIGDAYEQVAYVPVAYRFTDTCRHCGGNHHSNECPY